jgi:integrase
MHGQPADDAGRPSIPAYLPTLSKTSQKNYAYHLNYWIKEVGSAPLAGLDPEIIAQCRDRLLASGKTPSTCNHYLVSLQSVYRQAIKQWHWLRTEHSPMPSVAKCKGVGVRKRFLSDAELPRFLAECKKSASQHLYLAVMLAITTGARQAEIMWLRWRQVDLARGLIRLDKTKNGDQRSLPIVAEVEPLLRERRSQSGAIQLDGFIFPSPIADRKPASVRRAFNIACRRAEITNFRWHDLRHTHASLLAMNGASLPEIGAALGHRSEASTKRYTHLTEQHQHKVQRATMGKVLGGFSDDD